MHGREVPRRGNASQQLDSLPGKQLRQLSASCAVRAQQLPVLLRLAAIEPHDCREILELPRRPLVQGGGNGGVVALRVYEQHLVADGLRLVLVQEPQRAGQALGVEEVVAHVEHHVHCARLDQRPALRALGV